jgi:hypothetical protein
MEPAFLFTLFVIIAIGVMAAGFVNASKRRDAAAALATGLGMTYHPNDDLGITRLPHPIFRMGDRRSASSLVVGTMRDRPVVLFDYQYEIDRTDAEGKRSTSTYRFSGVTVELGVRCPPAVIRRERVGTKLANALGLGKDIQFESDEFNRSFEVRSDSQQFAFTLVDTAMMEWLMANAGDLDIQLDGSTIVVVTTRRPWTEMEVLASRVLDFTEQFPRLVWSSYGASGS